MSRIQHQDISSSGNYVDVFESTTCFCSANEFPQFSLQILREMQTKYGDIFMDNIKALQKLLHHKFLEECADVLGKGPAPSDGPSKIYFGDDDGRPISPLTFAALELDAAAVLNVLDVHGMGGTDVENTLENTLLLHAKTFHRASKFGSPRQVSLGTHRILVYTFCWALTFTIECFDDVIAKLME